MNQNENVQLLTSNDAFRLIKESGIVKNKQTFLRFVREGRIKGKMRHKREGYRFDKNEIDYFIQRNKMITDVNPFDEIRKLKEENMLLKNKMKQA